MQTRLHAPLCAALWASLFVHTATARADASTSPEAPTAPGVEAAAPSDHRFHHWAIGAFNGGNLAVVSLNLSNYNQGNGPPYSQPYATSISLPAIGTRGWLTHGQPLDLGIEVALGLATATSQHRAAPTKDTVGKPESQGNEVDYAPSGVFLHLGMPVAFYKGRHYTLSFIPEVNVGYAWARTRMSTQMSGLDSALQGDMHAVSLDAGVRAGPEISFGFVNIPELVVQPTVGILVHWDSGYASSQIGDQKGEYLSSHTSVSGTQNNVYLAQIGAAVNVLYYF